MTSTRPPATNLRGLRHYWRNDLIAGVSVALVALPLALGIAVAAGAPPISGLLSAIVAGLLGTFVRGSHVAINGPGNILIVIVASGLAAFGGGPDAFPHLLGAVVVAGGVQVVFGLLRLGKVGDVLPSAVIQGLLAAIGLIIMGKQLHLVLGRQPQASHPIDVFLEVPATLAQLHPGAAAIGLLSLVVLVLHPRIDNKVVHFVPGPLWVVLLAVPALLVAGALGAPWALDPEQRVTIPSDLFGALVRPDFSRVGEGTFWMVVATFALVNSLEDIVSVKAVDKLDTFRRVSNLDRNLIGMGVCSIVAGLLGGLPVLTVIARSSVNVNHGGKTGWSNFTHGLILLVCTVFLSGLMQYIPLAALAGILVYTGFKLCGPQVVTDALRKGPDHFLIFGVTLGATITWGLLPGIVVGIGAELLSQLVILAAPVRDSLALLWSTHVETIHEPGGPHLLRVHGVASFLNIPRLRPALEAVPPRQRLVVDFSPAALVDHTLLEYCHDSGRRYREAHTDATFEIIGLERHRALSDHPDALHVLQRPLRGRRLTARQQQIQALAERNGWTFSLPRVWDPDHLDAFHFFRLHPLEYHDTVVHGHFEVGAESIEWTMSDVTFDEGALVGEVYHTTALVLELPVELPALILEKEELLDRVLELAGLQDIDFTHFTDFSRRYVLRGSDEEEVRTLLTPELLAYLEREEVYHLEASGHDLVVFKFMRLATPTEIERMLAFAEGLLPLVLAAAEPD